MLSLSQVCQDMEECQRALDTACQVQRYRLPDGHPFSASAARYAQREQQRRLAILGLALASPAFPAANDGAPPPVMAA